MGRPLRDRDGWHMAAFARKSQITDRPSDMTQHRVSIDARCHCVACPLVVTTKERKMAHDMWRKDYLQTVLAAFLWFALAHVARADEPPSPGPSRAVVDEPSRPDPTQPKTAQPKPEQPTARLETPRPESADKDGFVKEYRPMDGPTLDESIPAAPLVAIAYGFVWLAVLGYVVFCAHGLRKIETDLSRLEEKLDGVTNKQ